MEAKYNRLDMEVKRNNEWLKVHTKALGALPG